MLPVEARALTAFDGATGWLNSSPLTTAGLRGRVVLVQFWTYTCINWLRTLPFVRAWSQRYKDRLVVIGVHTPEFAFEHDAVNVRRALERLRVDYPVVLDSRYAIWRAFENQYWPALYILDGRGRVRYRHFGEGEYDQSERAIQRLLVESGVSAVAGDTVVVEPDGVERQADWADLRSAETYLRAGAPADGRSWALRGKWRTTDEAIVAAAPGATLENRFHARDLHLVMAPVGRSAVPFRVRLDGVAPAADHGLDVDEDGNGTLDEPRMYQLIRQRSPIRDRRFQIECPEAGVEAFSFTFG